jgi:hypothetical protein
MALKVVDLLQAVHIREYDAHTARAVTGRLTEFGNPGIHGVAVQHAGQKIRSVQHFQLIDKLIVCDLGRDVSPEVIAEKVKSSGCKLVGLSALMTTTVPAMAETIELLHRECEGVTVIVGGAVLTEDYAKTISADKYCADAMEAVRFAAEYYENN